MRKGSNSRSGTATSLSGNRFHVSNAEEAIVKSHSCVFWKIDRWPREGRKTFDSIDCPTYIIVVASWVKSA